MVERARGLSGVSFIRALILFMRMPHSWPNHFSEASSPNKITLGIRFQHMNFDRGTHTVNCRQWNYSVWYHNGGYMILYFGSNPENCTTQGLWRVNPHANCMCAQLLSPAWLFVTQWTVAHQAPLSMGFPRQEYWSRWQFPTQGFFSTQGSNPCFLHWQVDSLPLSHLGSPM